MDIKKADSKGRVMVGDDGQVYSVHKGEGGVITLYPVKFPEVPKADSSDFRAVYYDPSRGGIAPDRVYIVSTLGGSSKSNAEYVADIANYLKVPVVVRAHGMGALAVDVLQDIVDRDVIGLYGV